MADIFPRVFDSDSYWQDLDELKSVGESQDDIDLLNAFVDELAGSTDACWQLLRRAGEHITPYFNCRAIECCHRAGYNVYRIRPLSTRLSRFRLIYALDNETDEVHLLAVTRKSPQPPQQACVQDYKYEPDHPITKRVFDEYERCGFQKLR